MTAQSTKETGNHHFLSNKDQINVENDIEESEVSYEEKQVSSWRILAGAVTLAAVTQT
jgi:hypothetical protein